MDSPRFEVTSEPPAGAAGQKAAKANAGAAGQRRKFLGVTFACCGIYNRVYINRDGTAYEGRCPKCGKPVKLRIGPGGTDARFFTAY